MEHMKIHSNKKLYQCAICKKLFHHLNILLINEHTRLHKLDNHYPYKCSICDLVFESKRSLKDHIRTHYMLKPFFCDVCSLPFKTDKTRTFHMKKHSVYDKTMSKSEQQPTIICFKHQCEICGVRWKFISGLYIHMKSHSAEQALEKNVWDCFLTEELRIVPIELR